MNKKIFIIFMCFILTSISWGYAQLNVNGTDIDKILLNEFSWQGVMYEMTNISEYTMMSSQKGFIAHKSYTLKNDYNIISHGITIFDSTENAISAMDWRIKNVSSVIIPKLTEDTRIDKLWVADKGVFLLKDSIVIEATVGENELLFDLLFKMLNNIEEIKKQ